MPFLGAFRNFERGDTYALRIEAAHYVLDGAVLTAGVDTLQHNEQRASRLGVQQVLQDPQAIEVLCKLRAGSGLFVA